jgi:hypothetical protein
MYYGLYNRLRVHVSASPKHVLRALYRKLKPSAKKRANRDARHAIARAILREHCDAREIFIRYRF